MGSNGGSPSHLSGIWAGLATTSQGWTGVSLFMLPLHVDSLDSMEGSDPVSGSWLSPEHESQETHVEAARLLMT